MSLNKKTAIVCIILFCIITYFPILGHEFITAWDDGWQVINRYTDNLSWYNIRLIFTDYYSGQYSPVNQLLYTIIYYFFGYNSVSFHLLSLILHMLNALLFFFIVLDTFPRLHKWCMGIAFAWLLFFCVQTHLRTYTWHDNTSLKMKMNNLLEEREKELHKLKK